MSTWVKAVVMQKRKEMITLEDIRKVESIGLKELPICEKKSVLSLYSEVGCQENGKLLWKECWYEDFIYLKDMSLGFLLVGFNNSHKYHSLLQTYF